MRRYPQRLQRLLNDRKEKDTFRQLPSKNTLVDFSSNDYLGFSKSQKIFENALKLLAKGNIQNGATGSRLLSGNHSLYEEVEGMLCDYHKTEAALVFNSGYDANIGFFSSVPQRGDVIFYDEFIHASIRDGIKMSNARAYKFKHNDVGDLRSHIERNRNANNEGSELYIVTESVFSMDGDSPDLNTLVNICEKYDCHLIVDEAHAVGVFGKNGIGLLQEMNIQDKVFARIITFGKALGCHGAAVLGKNELKDYLVNFARSFIYTTALPPHSLATILSAYSELSIISNEVQKPIENKKTYNVLEADAYTSNSLLTLRKNIDHFIKGLQVLNLKQHFVESNSAIQCCIIPGNTRIKNIARNLREKGFDVKPILSPTVPENMERLRFCIHSFNSKKEISDVLAQLATFVV